MKISLSWLKNYVSFTGPVQELADALTMAGLEVDAVFYRYAYLEKIIVGRVFAVMDHPNADKLKLCRVQAGNNTEITVVCGAPNVKPGMLAPLALPDSVMPDGTVIRAGVIRGEKSHGMLCSEFELGLGTDESGIMALEENCSIGDNLAKALNLSDMVLDIDLTPNRPDCLSMLGTAREIASFNGSDVNYPDTNIKDGEDQIFALTGVTIEAPADCPRYAARIVENITIGPSPFWLQDRLISIGLRPINNIVDITNFVMMETGQPLHAFDIDQLAENRIIVRRAGKGEAFQTLDGKKRTLSDTMLMICDADKPIAVGGVMGGLHSEVTPATTRVLIESACFDPVSIRKTAKQLGLNTDASHRFERGVDPDGTVTSLNRAALLMAEIGHGRLVKGIIDEHPGHKNAKIINLNIKDTNRLLGTDITAEKIADLLTSIEFKVENGTQGMLEVTVPTFRVDVIKPVDLMEEVARLWGY
ncbi:MAG: phenylalanine--tRNA ligase subunit beta [Deltaproteobacteria bacterium]|nr:phenylalanine--tRNA ligase subunit beta [Deltaproteobacteria bacterium]